MPQKQSLLLAGVVLAAILVVGFVFIYPRSATAPSVQQAATSTPITLGPLHGVTGTILSFGNGTLALKPLSDAVYSDLPATLTIRFASTTSIVTAVRKNSAEYAKEFAAFTAYVNSLRSASGTLSQSIAESLTPPSRSAYSTSSAASLSIGESVSVESAADIRTSDGIFTASRIIRVTISTTTPQ